MRLYRHLSFEERVKIDLLQRQGYTQTDIAKELGRDRSTIYRETIRNQCPYLFSYNHSKAQSKYKKRIKKPQGRIRDKEIHEYVINKIRTRWSPERISGRIRKDLLDKSISVETIYLFLYEEAPELKYLLARHHMRRHLIGQRKTHRKTHVKNRVLVTDREPSINTREVVGHWESDLMMGLKRKNSGLTFMVERKTRYTKILKINDITAKINTKNVIRLMKESPKHTRLSITYDNGLENAYHEQINYAVGCKSYFCNEGCPYEKGTVENTIGIARRIYPKGTDFDNISAAKVKKLENWLNDLPKKCLGWKTPREVFNQLCCT